VNAPLTAETAAAGRARAGLIYGLAAYGLWGILPIYFKLLKAVPSADIVAHRIVWSLGVLAILATFSGAWNQVGAAVRNRRMLAMLFLTAMLIGTNWLL
jgi:chloramphenicol-sensitive protein RarD